ncbi:PKD domain-containing protein [Pontibacter sp. MBLB2868]|uniref:PKD domain-containing protein n=1 Tax=Pontibacter sp. MBLB2868 TaxID=3451555 RepID=UPI003F74F3E6
MKRYLSYIASLLLFTLALSSCEEEDGSLGPAPVSEQVQFSTQPDANNPNIIHFKADAPGFKAVWDLGNGETATGMEVTGKYPLKGDYTVTLTMYTSGGSAANSKKVTIANTNPLMLDRPDYNFLTGGANALEGKTWVIDKEGAGHLGVGPVAGDNPEWYKAAANEKAGLGLYDDEMTFNLNGLSYTYKNNGDTFVNGAHAATLGGDPANGDQKVSYQPKTGLTWSIVEEGDKKFLMISNGGFLGYYTGVSKYEILALSENELYIRQLDSKNGDLAWYQRLVPKGYTVPKPVKPYKEAIDLKDDFDAPGNIVWQTDQLTFSDTYDNPAPLAGNTSAKVGQYIKKEGEAFAFANLFLTLDHKMDLTTKNKIKLKVFMPNYNDYVTQAGFDWANKNLLKQVSVKLQNSEDGQPWVSQVEVKQQVNQLDKWVELTFDFSSAAARKDLDRIVIQIGGEGNFIPGIFYIDDVQLLP